MNTSTLKCKPSSSAPLWSYRPAEFNASCYTANGYVTIVGLITMDQSTRSSWILNHNWLLSTLIITFNPWDCVIYPKYRVDPSPLKWDVYFLILTKKVSVRICKAPALKQRSSLILSSMHLPKNLPKGWSAWYFWNASMICEPGNNVVEASPSRPSPAGRLSVLNDSASANYTQRKHPWNPHPYP